MAASGPGGITRASAFEPSTAPEGEGQWLCADAGETPATCVVPNNCGDTFTKPLGCYVGTTLVADTQCGDRPSSTVTTGCGAWKCRHPILGTFVDCSDASICAAGCNPALPINVNTNAGEHLVSGPYKQTCIFNGSFVAPNNMCSVAPLGTYASTCHTSATCDLYCGSVDAAGVVTARSCSSELKWTPCLGECGASSTQDFDVYCSGTELTPGTVVTITNSVAASMCPEPEFPRTRSCTSFQACAGYQWHCGDSRPCTDASGADVGFSSCSPSCSSSLMYRSVTCVAMHANGTAMGIVPPEACVAAVGPAPVSSKPCPRVCAGVWRCYPADPTAPYTLGGCTDISTLGCPSDGCSAAAPASRRLACVHSGSELHLPASSCAALPLPVLAGTCPVLRSECISVYDNSACDVEVPFIVQSGLKMCVDDDEEFSAVGKKGACFNPKTLQPADESVCETSYKLCELPYCAGAQETTTYSWTVNPDECLPICRSVQFQNPTCMATTGTREPRQVDVSFCANVPNKPLDVVPCGEAACENGGTCTSVSFPGGPADAGVCTCPRGFSGPLCATQLALSGVTYSYYSGRVHWSASSGRDDLIVLIYYRKSSGAPPVGPPLPPIIPVPTLPPAVAVTPTSVHKSLSPLASPAGQQAVSPLATESTEPLTLLAVAPMTANSFPVPLPDLPAGQYDIVVKVPGGAEFYTTIDISRNCEDPCMNGGTCNSEGLCACVNGFSGPSCEFSPCAAAACNPIASVCDMPSASSAVCVCSSGFTGARCDSTSAPCALDTSEGTCRNGGVRGAFLSAGVATCGACKCTGLWTGSLCNTCGISCGAGGVLDAGCSTCTCKPGYHGSLCAERHVTYTVNFVRSPAIEWFFTASGSDRVANEAAFKSELSLSLSLLGSTDSVIPVSVSSIKSVKAKGVDYAQVSLQVGSYAADSELMALTYRAVAAITQQLTTGGTYSATAPQAASKADVVSSFPVFDSLYVEKGVSAKDENCVDDATTECPKGNFGEAALDDDPSSGGGGLTSDEKIIVGVCVGVGGAIVLGLIVYFAFIKTSTSAKVAASPSETEMASTTRHPTEV